METLLISGKAFAVAAIVLACVTLLVLVIIMHILSKIANLCQEVTSSLDRYEDERKPKEEVIPLRTKMPTIYRDLKRDKEIRDRRLREKDEAGNLSGKNPTDQV